MAVPVRDPFAPDRPNPSYETIHIPTPSLTLHDGTPVEPSRQMMVDVNPSRLQIPHQLMRRPGYGREGKAIKLRLNSHHVENTPNARYYQYAVSLGHRHWNSSRANTSDSQVQIGDGTYKRALIKAIWASEQLNQNIPGGIKEWIYDGNALAWYVIWTDEVTKTNFY